MSRRNKILIIFGVALLILLVVIGILWFLNSRQPEEDITNTNQGIEVPGNLPTSSAGPSPELSMSAEQQNMEAGIRAISSTFAERFGSYSNQGNFDNLESLRDLMTLQMRASTDEFIASQDSFNSQQINEGASYYGITTNALTVDIISIDEDLGRAEVVVKTQRVETKISTNNPRSFYQDLNLTLVQRNDSWKVDSATWVSN